jgi:hypothetical protein
MENDEIETPKIKEDSSCPRCGLRSYGEFCQSCGTPVVDKSDDEDEEYDWRETRR